MNYFATRGASRPTFARPLFFAGAAASLMIFAAVGCGSGGGSAPSGLPVLSSSGGGTTLASFLGRAYSSQAALADGQIGTLSVTVAADSTASGTLQIVDPSRGANVAKSRLVIATPSLSGTFDPATGAINLTGSYTLNGQTVPISITGTLPTPPSVTGGSVTVTINGQSYTSTFGGTANPTPSPSSSPSPSPSASPSPSPSASPSPNPSASPSPSPASGAVQFALVSKTPDCNFTDPGFSSLPIADARFVSAAGQLYQFTSTINNSAKTAIFTVGWQRHHSGGNFVPETFMFTPSPQIGPFGDDFQGILYTSVTIQTGPLSVGAWRPTGGTLAVVAINGNKVTVRGDNVEFTPTPSPGTNGAGAFIANFTVTYDAVTGL